MRRHALLVVGAAIAAALTLPTAALAGHQGSGDAIKGDMGSGSLGHGLVIREQGGISYVSGGVGDEQQNALTQASRQFNLKLTMSTRGGKFVGGGDVRIENAQGNTVLETRANGPMFLAKLPAGQYKIHVNAEGQSFTRNVNVTSSGQQQVSLVIPAEAEGAPVRAGDAPAPDTYDMLKTR